MTQGLQHYFVHMKLSFYVSNCTGQWCFLHRQKKKWCFLHKGKEYVIGFFVDNWTRGNLQRKNVTRPVTCPICDK
ncbi:hypothetical protein MtrunA17_Chr4g0057921 [Medicago truncatula]|uniref:Uncharacterized protein n=1 Tax=Medicago truncatula TaxID=3880 RepID=A0A396IGN2_MEDTR|nr:hypothetical protein MtrunA17_Chr4g0057921 [Medicago truncatula]